MGVGSGCWWHEDAIVRLATSLWNALIGAIGDAKRQYRRAVGWEIRSKAAGAQSYFRAYL